MLTCAGKSRLAACSPRARDASTSNFSTTLLGAPFAVAADLGLPPLPYSGGCVEPFPGEEADLPAEPSRPGTPSLGANFPVAAGSGLVQRPSSSLSPAGLLAEQPGSDAPFADGDGSGRSSESGAAAELLGDLSGWDASAHGDSIDSDATPHQDATDSDTASPGDPDSTTASLEDMGMQAIRRQS